jgi:hypothetical protein
MGPKVSVITPSIRPEYLHITQECLENQTNQDFEWLVEIGLRNRGFTLPTDWNKLIRRAQGDIIFIIQDCISFPTDAVEQIAKLDYDHKAYTFPVSKDSVWDWRKSEPRKLTGNEWEIDMGAAPRSLFYDVGGFDETFCEGWSWENVEIGWRAVAAGYSFYSSHATEGIGIDHDALRPHPFRESLPKNAPKANETMRKAERGDYKKPYLF